MSDIKLTDEQKELVEKNHNLIYAYAKSNELSLDEYYDILAIALCKAAMYFDDSICSFSTFAYRCMSNELSTYWAQLKNKSAVPENIIVSYDAQDVRDDPDNTSSFLECFSDNKSYEDMEYKHVFKDFLSKLEDKESDVLKFLIKGFTQTEIADKLECRQQTVSYHISSIRSKANEYLLNNY